MHFIPVECAQLGEVVYEEMYFCRNEHDIPITNSFEEDCLPPNGTFGAIRFVRESMTKLPLAGTYQGTVNINISPQ